jgi:spore germination cell wall hydrolase CwlJ-like protein
MSVEKLADTIAVAVNEVGPVDAPPAHIQQDQANDQQVVAACLVAEAGGEQDPVKAMTAVMNVIANRARGDAWYGKTIVGVVKKPKQFSCFNGGTARVIRDSRKHAQWLTATRIVATAEAGKLPDITHGATHYYAARGDQAIKMPQHIKSMTRTVSIGNHDFFRAAKP